MVSRLSNTEINWRRLSIYISENDYLLPDPLGNHVDIGLYCRKLITLGRVYVFEEASQILGICMGYINDYDSLTAHLQVLLVKASQQHQGIGGQLVNFFISEAREANMKEIRLTCDKCNDKAKAFYNKLGFAKSAIEHPNSNKMILSFHL